MRDVIKDDMKVVIKDVIKTESQTRILLAAQLLLSHLIQYFIGQYPCIVSESNSNIANDLMSIEQGLIFLIENDEPVLEIYKK